MLLHDSSQSIRTQIDQISIGLFCSCFCFRRRIKSRSACSRKPSTKKKRRRDADFGSTEVLTPNIFQKRNAKITEDGERNEKWRRQPLNVALTPKQTNRFIHTLLDERKREKTLENWRKEENKAESLESQQEKNQALQAENRSQHATLLFGWPADAEAGLAGNSGANSAASGLAIAVASACYKRAAKSSRIYKVNALQKEKSSTCTLRLVLRMFDFFQQWYTTIVLKAQVPKTNCRVSVYFFAA